MAYRNPLHTPLSTASSSGYSSLAGALNSTPTPSQFISPFRRRLPQAPYTPSSKWKNSIGRLNHLQSPIAFDYHGYYKQGISMEDARIRGVGALLRMIQGPDDLVLAHTDLEKITLRIIWPGYEYIDWARSIDIKAQGPITRARLALIICQIFRNFGEKARSECSTAPEWHLGPSGICFRRLFLVSLVNVFENVWQADIAVDL